MSTSQEPRAVFFHFHLFLCSDLYAFAVGVQWAVFLLAVKFSTSIQVTEILCVSYAIKGKAIPLQGWTDPEGFKRLSFSDFKTIGT
jgi:hypothetical protein